MGEWIIRNIIGDYMGTTTGIHSPHSLLSTRELSDPEPSRAFRGGRFSSPVEGLPDVRSGAQLRRTAWDFGWIGGLFFN